MNNWKGIIHLSFSYVRSTPK